MRAVIAISSICFVSLVTPRPASGQSVAEGLLTTPIIVQAATQPPQPTAPPPKAFEYSDGYRTRAKIHKISSFATLPLFGTEVILGQSLYSDPSSNKKDAHLAVAVGMGTLFAVNTTTGVWNLIESRKDPVHRKRRLTHGIMMLAADAGFLATAALGPESEHGESSGSRSTHRAVALTSIGLAVTSYLIMLFGGN